MIETLKGLAAWALMLGFLFLLIWGLLWAGKQWYGFQDNCNAHGGTVTRDFKCVQEVKL